MTNILAPKTYGYVFPPQIIINYSIASPESSAHPISFQASLQINGQSKSSKSCAKPFIWLTIFNVNYHPDGFVLIYE